MEWKPACTFRLEDRSGSAYMTEQDETKHRVRMLTETGSRSFCGHAHLGMVFVLA